MNYGIQLYSVRDMSNNDFEKTLREVAVLGYEFVEPPASSDIVRNMSKSGLISTV